MVSIQLLFERATSQPDLARTMHVTDPIIVEGSRTGSDGGRATVILRLPLPTGEEAIAEIPFDQLGASVAALAGYFGEA
jgi:hypothetical protein